MTIEERNAAIKELIKKRMKENADNPARAKKMLQDSGMYTKQGRLKQQFLHSPVKSA